MEKHSLMHVFPFKLNVLLRNTHWVRHKPSSNNFHMWRCKCDVQTSFFPYWGQHHWRMLWKGLNAIVLYFSACNTCVCLFSTCKDNRGIYSALRLDKVFNISSYLNTTVVSMVQCNSVSASMLKLLFLYILARVSCVLWWWTICNIQWIHSIPSIKHNSPFYTPKFTKDVVARLNSLKIDLRGIILLEAEGKQNLLDFSEAGLLEINYADYLEEVTEINTSRRHDARISNVLDHSPLLWTKIFKLFTNIALTYAQTVRRLTNIS